jgi:iron complex transport system ATP-binding protein
MSNRVIEIRDLSFWINGKMILDSVCFDVYEGEYFSIIGPNGAGKTTLLRCLMRIYGAPRGTILVRGRPVEKIGQRSLAREISYVPQGEGHPVPFTVAEFVIMGRYPYWSPFTSIRAEDRSAAHEAMELTKIDHLARRRMDTLSGGERQTAFIAAAIAQGADILLLDEPATFLDPKHESDIHGILRRLNGEYHRTIVSVTHDINRAVLESDRVAILKDGAVVFIGPAEDVMDNAVLFDAYGKAFSFIEHPVTGQRVIVPDVGEQ